VRAAGTFSSLFAHMRTCFLPSLGVIVVCLSPGPVGPPTHDKKSSSIHHENGSRPAPTDEMEDVIGNLLYALHMIAHVHTNILLYRGHICHEGLHV
jgi:hypothetical protein